MPKDAIFTKDWHPIVFMFRYKNDAVHVKDKATQSTQLTPAGALYINSVDVATVKSKTEMQLP